MAALQNLHLAPEDEDDLYKGYDVFQVDELEEDPEFQRIVSTQHGRNKRSSVPVTGMGRPPLAGRPLGTSGFRLGTSSGGVAVGGRLSTGYAVEGGSARPMTSTGAAGFSRSGAIFDPLGQAGTATSKIIVPPLDPRPEDSPEEIIRQLEKKVNILLEESAEVSSRGDRQLALDKAKEASRKERILCKQREQAGLTEHINLDLTYSVLFNLANQYHANSLYNEALNTYLLIVKNKLFGSGGRLRINMGNIYFEQKKYPLAIKNYRMALDQIPDTHRTVRFRILQNICTVYIRMRQYSDAINTYEHIMDEMKENVDYTIAMNLLLCYYALGDSEKLKRHFQRMVQITTGTDIDEDRYFPTDEDDPNQRMLIEVIEDDSLRKIEKEEKRKAEKTILNAAKLIAPVIEGSFASGFDWCIEVVKSSHHAEMASELEITKALTFLREKDISRAIDTLKECGRKDSKMADSAATNLSFIYYLKGDISQAEKYADIAIQLDHYNPRALVNKGNCLYAQQKFEDASGYFQEALSVEATCFEALYNLGLTYKSLGDLSSALQCFTKLQMIFKNLPQVIYQIADIYDRLEDTPQAIEWFMQLVTLVPTDPGVLARLGELHDVENDRPQAYHYYYESFRYCPTNIDVISWLGAYFMDSQYCDKAVFYFEKATLIQPNQVNWQLMVASCYRKIGNYQQALHYYEEIHKRFPDNIDCLKFLVRLHSDLGRKELSDHYANLLKKAEKNNEIKKQRVESGGSSDVRESSGNIKTKDRLSSGDSGSSGGGVTRRADPSYSDPLGQLPERPRTSAHPKPPPEDEFEDVELGDDLLPE